MKTTGGREEDVSFYSIHFNLDFCIFYNPYCKVTLVFCPLSSLQSSQSKAVCGAALGGTVRTSEWDRLNFRCPSDIRVEVPRRQWEGGV